jgi:hypothetical protein
VKDNSLLHCGLPCVPQEERFSFLVYFFGKSKNLLGMGEVPAHVVAEG